MLLSDDVSVFLEMEKTLYRRDGIEILVAHTGREVLELAKKEFPKLILIDLHLPEVEGDECCRIVKSDPALNAIPVVLMANIQWEDEIRRCRDSGCDEVVFKPYNRDHLLRITRELLGLSDRSASRARVRLPVYFNSDFGENNTGASIDLSTGGMFVESKIAFSIGTWMNILFHLPGRRESIRCRGRVAWVNRPKELRKTKFPAGLGIQFSALEAKDRDAIRDFLTRV